MGRSPCCDKGKVRKGPWSIEEDRLLRNFIMKYGNGGNWISLPKKAGLNRCGKSCRLRWLNYLRPGINHNDFTEEEDRVIYTLYHTIGSRWSVIASNLQQRTDNDVKNYWNTKLKKKIMEGKFKNFNPTTNTIKQSLRKSEEMDFEMDQNQFHLHPEINNGDQISAMEESEEEKETKNNLVSHAICSHEESLSSFGCYDNQNSSSFASIISELSSFDDQSSNDLDDFWLDLLSGSSEDVIFSIQLEEKMIEMASLLDV